MLNLASIYQENVTVLRFRHNRGKADALALGYREAKGEIVFTMDADLQDDPTEKTLPDEATTASKDKLPLPELIPLGQSPLSQRRRFHRFRLLNML